MTAVTGCGGAAIARPAGDAAFPEVSLTRSATAPGHPSWAPWPQAGHDGRRSGSSPAVGPQNAHVRWRRTLEGAVTPGPVIGADGTVYAASNSGVLHALDPRTGADRWRYDGGGGYGNDLSTSPAVLPDGTLLWPGPRGRLVALTAAGDRLWWLDLDGMGTSPAVSPDGVHVVVGTTSGRVTALEVRGARHRVLWTTELHGASYGSVALSPTDPRRSYTTVDSALVALDEGRVAWKHDVGSQIEVSPAVAPDGTVTVGSNDPFQYGISPAGKQVWRYRRGSWSYSSPVVTDDGLAVFGDHRARVTAVDASTGALRGRWQGPLTEPSDGRSLGVWTAPVLDARHDIYWGTRSGHVVGRAADGRSLLDIELGGTIDSYPALGLDGLLVLGNDAGILVGIGS